MKIAILAYSANDNSGTSVVAADQAILFSKSGHDVTIFTLIPGDKKLEVPVMNLPHPLMHLPFWKYPWMYLFAVLPPPLHSPLIHRCLKPLAEFDVVIAYDYPLSWLVYYAKKRYPIKYLWVLQGLQLPETGEFAIERLYYRILASSLYRRSAANADLVIAETAFLQGILKKRLSIDSVVIQNPTYLFMDRHTTGEKICQKYQLKDGPVILYIDRLEEHKGIETLLDAFNIVLELIPNAKLMIIGKCTRKHYWRKIEARRDKSVIFIDCVPHNEIASFYAASTVFATCAVFEEGLSHTIIEAQAFGKPVVAFDLAAHREVVKNGETGILVSPVGSTSEFALALLKLLNNSALTNNMGEEAVHWTEELGNKAIQSFKGLLDKIKEM